MTDQVDVFNGDADGICALHQLRLVEPAAATLVTGVKRDIQLLDRLSGLHDAAVVVLDISLDSNRAGLSGLLERGCRVRYFDHHYAGEIPTHGGLEPHIDTAPDVCTSLLMDRYLEGACRAWAVTAAFGDNLVAAATAAAEPLGLSATDVDALRMLGELINYNGYGESLADLHFAPDDLYRAIHPFDDPLDFFRAAPEAEVLHSGFAADLARAERLEPVLDAGAGRVFRFPGEPWARRIMGVFSNRMANETPHRATAALVDNPDGSLRISVRAPLASPQGADGLCRRYPTGGGRAGAAGINALPAGELPRFLQDFQAAFGA